MSKRKLLFYSAVCTGTAAAIAAGPVIVHFHPEYTMAVIGGEAAIGVVVMGEVIKIAMNKWFARFIPSPPSSDTSTQTTDQPESEASEIPSIPSTRASMPDFAPSNRRDVRRNALNAQAQANLNFGLCCPTQQPLQRSSTQEASEADPEMGAIRPREIGQSELARELQARARENRDSHLYEYCRKQRNEKKDVGTFGAMVHTIDENTRYGATTDPEQGHTLADRVLRNS